MEQFKCIYCEEDKTLEMAATLSGGDVMCADCCERMYNEAKHYGHIHRQEV